jgi:hypothetical protein
MQVRFPGIARGWLAGALLFLPAGAALAHGPTVQSKPIIRWPVVHDLSLAVRVYPARPKVPLRHEQPEPRRYRHPHVGRGPDPVVQDVETSAPAPLRATIGLSFEGIGNVDRDYPPDTNASVGDTQVVEAVNESYEVFDKSTGKLTFGPAEIASLFTGMKGVCGTARIDEQDDTDPIVVYDKMANRWISTLQISSSGAETDNHECIAVSTSSDATGSYFRYDYSFGKIYPDYPKFGIWPDAYYASYDVYHPGAEVCAYDRAAMLGGKSSSAICFQLRGEYVALLPSDQDGSALPPAGEPAFYVDQSSDNRGSFLNVFQFHVDFGAPARSTFTGPFKLEVPSYTDPCNVSRGICVPQSDTAQMLDTLSGYMMTRLAYRRTGGHESLVVSHNVKGVTAQVDVRWYEIRSPLNPVLYQAGTLASGGTSLWLGSIAMDRMGNIALGFSDSNSAIHPGIQFTGRVPSDGLGKMESIATILGGTGSQTGTRRWGDYSSMAIDPADDCTFWYANEYLKKDSPYRWSTHLASLKFPDCR